MEKQAASLKDEAKQTIFNDLNREDETVILRDTGSSMLIRSKTGMEYPLRQESYILGSGIQADIRIEDNRKVSRRHAKVFSNGDDFYIEDIGSTNGTVLNGEFLEKNRSYRLDNGSRIILSNEEFIFKAGE